MNLEGIKKELGEMTTEIIDKGNTIKYEIISLLESINKLQKKIEQHSRKLGADEE